MISYPLAGGRGRGPIVASRVPPDGVGRSAPTVSSHVSPSDSTTAPVGVRTRSAAAREGKVSTIHITAAEGKAVTVWRAKMVHGVVPITPLTDESTHAIVGAPAFGVCAATLSPTTSTAPTSIAT